MNPPKMCFDNLRSPKIIEFRCFCWPDPNRRQRQGNHERPRTRCDRIHEMGRKSQNGLGDVNYMRTHKCRKNKNMSQSCLSVPTSSSSPESDGPDHGRDAVTVTTRHDKDRINHTSASQEYDERTRPERRRAAIRGNVEMEAAMDPFALMGNLSVDGLIVVVR